MYTSNRSKYTTTGRVQDKHTQSSRPTCSLYRLMLSLYDLTLLTANTHRNPSPVLIYWSLIALQVEQSWVEAHNVRQIQLWISNYEFQHLRRKVLTRSYEENLTNYIVFEISFITHWREDRQLVKHLCDASLNLPMFICARLSFTGFVEVISPILFVYTNNSPLTIYHWGPQLLSTAQY